MARVCDLDHNEKEEATTVISLDGTMFRIDTCDAHITDGFRQLLGSQIPIRELLIRVLDISGRGHR